jgi:hypothetical protein
MRAGARPLHVLLITLGLLLLQGPMLLHLLLVRHTTCEHGELIEVSRSNGGNGGVAVTPRDPSDQPQVRVSQSNGGGHDHCDAMALRHRVAEVGPAVASASLSWIEPVTVGGERSEMRAVPLLSLAPKSSPPASAV